MKSFISEDKTVLKAIEKAIALAENPSSFTIKVLDSGVQSIFWWQNKAAIILFSYELDQSIESKKVLKKQGSQITKKNFKNQGISEQEGTSFLENRCHQKSTNPLSFNHKEKKIIKGEGESRSNPFQENDSREMKMGTQTSLSENLIQGKQVEEKDKKLLQEPLGWNCYADKTVVEFRHINKSGKEDKFICYREDFQQDGRLSYPKTA